MAVSNRSQLTSEEHRLSYYHYLAGAHSPCDFVKRISARLSRLGFYDFSYHRLQAREEIEPLLSTIPSNMMKDYRCEELYNVDLSLAHIERSNQPIFLSNIVSYINAAPFVWEPFSRYLLACNIFNRGGYPEFYTVPLPTTNGNGKAFFSFTSKNAEPTDLQHKVAQHRGELQLLAEGVDYIATTKFSNHFMGNRERNQPVIHPRPLELITTMIMGDCSIEQAADRLGISISTANQHVAAARKAFGVRTTLGAIACCIRKGLIVLE